MSEAKKWFCINMKIENEDDVEVQIFGDQKRSGNALIIAAWVRSAILAEPKNLGLGKRPVVEWREDP